MLVFKGNKSGCEVDHKNGIKTDNKLSNLRYCFQGQNKRFNNHKRKNKSSKYVGICFKKRDKVWSAEITHLKIKHLLPKNTRAIIYESYPEYNTAKGANLINNVLRGLTADQRLTGILKQIIANKL